MNDANEVSPVEGDELDGDLEPEVRLACHIIKQAIDDFLMSRSTRNMCRFRLRQDMEVGVEAREFLFGDGLERLLKLLGASEVLEVSQIRRRILAVKSRQFNFRTRSRDSRHETSEQVFAYHLPSR